MHENVPLIMCRIIINNLYFQLKDGEIVLTSKHRELAFSKLENIRGDIIFDYVQKMGLSSRIDNNFYKQLAHSHIAKNKFHEAALIIHKFKFREDFDIITLMDKLVLLDRIPAARQLCEMDTKFTLYLVNKLASSDNCKVAQQIIAEFKLDINQFPDLKDRIMKQSMRYYLSRFLYKKPTSEDFISLDRIEDLFNGFKNMLS